MITWIGAHQLLADGLFLLETDGVHHILSVLQLSWFPFFLFDTDWMGREVYHGDPKGNASERKAYDDGVREGAFGLLLNSVRACDQFCLL